MNVLLFLFIHLQYNYLGWLRSEKEEGRWATHMLSPEIKNKNQEDAIGCMKGKQQRSENFPTNISQFFVILIPIPFIYYPILSITKIENTEDLHDIETIATKKIKLSGYL